MRFWLKVSLLLAQLHGYASAQDVTGAIHVFVADPSGATVRMAEVWVTGPSLVRAQTTSAGPDGVFRFPALPPGSYSVQAIAKSFVRAVELNVAAAVGKTTRVDFRLEVASANQQVTVAAKVSAIDMQDSSTTENIPSELSDRLPRKRSFDSLLKLAPGVRGEPLSGGFQVDGASGSENVFMVDGVDTTGIQNGLLPIKTQLPFEFVEEVQVRSSGFAAQFPAAAGGVVSVVLRSGGEALHGNLYLYAQTDALNARPRPVLTLDPFSQDRPLLFHPPRDRMRMWNPGVTVGGPIVRRRLWFYAGFAPELTRTGREVTFIQNGQRGSFSNTSRRDFAIGKLDAAPGVRLRTFLSMQYSPQREMGLLPSPFGTDSPQTAFASQGWRSPFAGYRGGADWAASNRLVVSGRAGYTADNFKDYGVPQGVYIRYRNSNLNLPGVPDALQAPAGDLTPWNAQVKANYFRRLNANADVAYRFQAGGTHEVRVGFSHNQLFHRVDAGFVGGFFIIAWDQDYVGQLTPDRNRGAYGHYIERIRGTYGDVRSYNSGLYVQDAWSIGRWTIQAGVRADREYVPSYRTEGWINPRPIEFSFGKKLAPRLGVAWDVTGSGRWKLAASYGRYFDQMKYSLPITSLGGAQWLDYAHALESPDVGMLSPTNTPGRLFEVLDYRPPLSDRSQNRIDPELEPFRKHGVDVLTEYMLRPGLSTRVRYTHNRLDRTIEHAGSFGGTGVQGYLTNPGFNLSAQPGFSGAGMRPTPRAVRNYDGLELRIDRRMAWGHFLSLSYTLSRLWGNYSGLASSDERGRPEPNVTASFDYPWGQYDQLGNQVYGPLATDRPHVLKAFSSFPFHWRGGVTTVAPVVSVGSGTPMSTRVNVMGMQVFANGRGDLGRTPVLSTADLLVRHEFRVRQGWESMRLGLEMNVSNLFNAATVTDVNTALIHPFDRGLTFFPASDVFQGYDYRVLMSAQGLRPSPLYGLPMSFEAPRDVRLGLRFLF